MSIRSEFADNPEQRTPLVLLLDTSGSMSGEKINALNRAIVRFKNEVENNHRASLSVEVAIITFGGSVQLIQDFVTIDNFSPRQLTANGGTPMGQAIDSALDLLSRRKAVYKQNGIAYCRPWILMITDGEPTDSWQTAAQKVKNTENNKGVTFFSVGVQEANMNILKQISSKNKPMKLDGLKFEGLFIWLSNSMAKISGSQLGDQVSLDSTSTFTVSTSTY